MGHKDSHTITAKFGGGSMSRTLHVELRLNTNMIKQIHIDSLYLQLQRKAIKNLYIRIIPPDGQVHISAPLRMSEANIRAVVIERMTWIKTQQQKFTQQVKASTQELVNGECHYLWGRAYRLEVIEHVGRHSIQVSNDRIHLTISPNTTTENRLLVLHEFYRAELKNRLEKMIDYWQTEMAVQSSGVGIKRMKTRWGSCNTGTKKIWFNLALVQKPLECVEYVVVHELAHLLEPSHNHRFKAYMDKFMPNWRERKALLNQMPLAELGD